MLIYYKVCERLSTLGYCCEVSEMAVSILHAKITSLIQVKNNIWEIPKEYEPFIVDRICGEYLSAKLASGDISDFDTELIVASVSAGDTTVSYQTDNISKKDRLQNLFDKLMEAGDFSSLRKMKW